MLLDFNTNLPGWHHRLRSGIDLTIQCRFRLFRLTQIYPIALSSEWCLFARAAAAAGRLVACRGDLVEVQRAPAQTNAGRERFAVIRAETRFLDKPNFNWFELSAYGAPAGS